MSNKDRVYRWECPECGENDENGKYLATAKHLYCGNCAGDTGKDVLLKKWIDSSVPSGGVS